MGMNFKQDSQLQAKFESLKKYTDGFHEVNHLKLELEDHYVEFTLDEITYEIKSSEVSFDGKYAMQEFFTVIYYFLFENNEGKSQVNIANVMTFDNIISAWDYAEEGIIELLAQDHIHDDDEEPWPYDKESIDTSIIPDQYEAMDQDIF